MGQAPGINSERRKTIPTLRRERLDLGRRGRSLGRRLRIKRRLCELDTYRLGGFVVARRQGLRVLALLRQGEGDWPLVLADLPEAAEDDLDQGQR